MPPGAGLGRVVTGAAGSGRGDGAGGGVRRPTGAPVLTDTLDTRPGR
jgi:hypothetical protein